ncbi:MAG: N-acetylglucosamine-6-phosphate deacetylase [Planctomycetes bacterium]|nr:N-acetylglucosamine-6-phosphate deacetylase [Planctomycetota bacterium]MBL7142627.1 N-acetylglucosamine-6-phosphate deacetylase [Phycisphaerae bacterium]
MSQRLLITNCRLFDVPEETKTTSILIENGTITQIGQINPPTGCKALDAQGRIAAPGFIDVHIQGAGGADVLDATPEALKAISQTCAHFGATSFLATTVFKPEQKNQHLTVAAEHVGRDLGGANLLGIHLEGPFISMQKKGMIQPDCICPPSMQVLDKILNITNGQLKMMTIAPELPDCTKIIKRLIDSSVIASFGHSSATYEQTIDGFNAGISHVTHLFNAMPSLHHRSPGPLAAIFQTKHITAQLIPDGVHIHPAVLKLAYETLGPNRTIPITDGMQALGLGDGIFIYNSIEYESKNGTARYKDGTLIGTALGLSQLLERLTGFTGCPFETAIKAVTQKTAELLGIEDRKGSIEPGKDADLVLLDRNYSVHTTIVAGKVVFPK